MLYPLLKELLISEDLSLDEGKITFFDQRMQLILSSYFAYSLHNAKNFWDTAYLQYESMKQANMGEWFKNAIKKRKLEGDELIKWATHYFNLGGYGIFKFKLTDILKGKALVNVENSTIALAYKELFGVSKEPVCHITRGGIAAGANSLIQRNDLEVIETACVAQGNPHCVMLINPKGDLLKTKKRHYLKQLKIK